MRSFVTKTAGATFYAGNTYTFNVRKETIEIIFKMEPKGWYIVVNLMYGVNGWELCCSWGDFFRRVLNHENPPKLLAMLKKTCPLVYELFTNAKGDYYCNYSPDQANTCIAARLPEHLQHGNDFILVLSNDDLLNRAEDLGIHCLNVYQEIRNKCPFPGWKEGLKNL